MGFYSLAWAVSITVLTSATAVADPQRAVPQRPGSVGIGCEADLPPYSEAAPCRFPAQPYTDTSISGF